MWRRVDVFRAGGEFKLERFVLQGWLELRHSYVRVSVQPPNCPLRARPPARPRALLLPPEAWSKAPAPA